MTQGEGLGGVVFQTGSGFLYIRFHGVNVSFRTLYEQNDEYDPKVRMRT